jgi:hypothetical protein
MWGLSFKRCQAIFYGILSRRALARQPERKADADPEPNARLAEIIRRHDCRLLDRAVLQQERDRDLASRERPEEGWLGSKETSHHFD